MASAAKVHDPHTRRQTDKDMTMNTGDARGTHLLGADAAEQRGMDCEDGSRRRDKEGITFSRSNRGHRTKKCLIFLVFMLIVLVIVFFGLFIYYFLNRDSETDATNICLTTDCVTAAALMANKMNQSADPCQDFHEYACGLYNKVTVLPDDTILTGSLYAINDQNQVAMKGLLTEDITSDQPEYLQNMKRLYQSCINEVQIEKIGLQSFKKESNIEREWPTLNPSWDDRNFDINEVLARYAAIDAFPLIAPAVLADFRNSSKKSLYVAPGDIGIPKENFEKPSDDPILVAFRIYIMEFAIELGADRARADEDATELMKLFTALSKIHPSAQETQKLESVYNPVTLRQLSNAYPDIDVPRLLRATFSTANMTLEHDFVVINLAPGYFSNLTRVLAKFPNRAIQNLIGFIYAKSQVEGLTKRLREIELNLNKVYYGQSAERPRWILCVNKVSTIFTNGMAKQFVGRTFSEEGKAYVWHTYMFCVVLFVRLQIKVVQDNTKAFRSSLQDIHRHNGSL